MSHDRHSSSTSISTHEDNLFVDILHEAPLYGHRRPARILGSIVYCILLAGYAAVAIGAPWIFIPIQQLAASILCSCNVALLLITGIFQQYLVYEVQKVRLQGYYIFSQKLKHIIRLPFATIAYAFSPLKIRLGGTLQDKVTYSTNQQPCPHFVKNTSAMFGFTPGCLPMSRWDQLNNFFNKSGAVIIFGLNALNGRTIASDGSAVGPWDSSNAASFIRYTVDKGYNIYAWELGNELSGSGVGTRVAAAQYASDVIKLDSLVNDIYAGSNVKPQIIAPGGFFAADWYKELVDKTPNSLDIVTHHIYNLGPGVDTHLVEKILDPGYLDGMIATFRDVRDLVKDTGAAAWVGEAGGAYNSGHNLVTNAFVFSFWYLDQLGMSSKYNTKTYCRQTLIGGNYGLLNTTTLLPNPDYYSALLWNQLMGTNVLFANFTGTNKIRAYSHCAKQSKGIVLLLINLDGNTTVQVHLTTTPNTITRAWRHHYHHKHIRFAQTIHGAAAAGTNSREEYHLTAMNGDLHSQTMLLNGKILAVNSSGDIPPLEPTSVNSSDPIRVAPYSIVFVHIPSIQLPACA